MCDGSIYGWHDDGGGWTTPPPKAKLALEKAIRAMMLKKESTEQVKKRKALQEAEILSVEELQSLIDKKEKK